MSFIFALLFALASPPSGSITVTSVSVAEPDPGRGLELKCERRPCIFAYRFSAGIHQDSVEAFQAFVRAVNQAHADALMLEIDTTGGLTDAGHEMSRTIEMSPTPIVCVGDGLVASMGFYVLQSCDRRFMTKRTVMLVHQVAAGAEEFEANPRIRLTPNKLREVADRVDSYTTAYLFWCSHKLKISYAEFASHVTDGNDWFFDWREAQRIGAVDKVLEYTPNELLRRMQHGLQP